MKTTKVLKVLLTTMMMAMVLVGCGNKNTEANEINNEVEVMAPVEKTEIATEEVETTEYEEVIGDLDLTATSLTMDGMQKLVLGLDIPLSEDSPNHLKDLCENDFEILFPSPAYITEQYSGVTKAELESIKFNIDMAIDNIASYSISDEGAQIAGKYIVIINEVVNDKYGFTRTYDIYNTETQTTLGITLVITKVRDYQEYCDNLVEEYVPAFEEVLLNNLYRLIEE